MVAFRVLLESIVDGAYRIFKGQGRPQEQCTGALFQHYGLRTQPPANVDLFTIQYGNNHFSVAENDGALLGKTLNSGDVYLYSDSTNYICILPASSTLKIVSSGDITIESDSKVYINAPQVNINGGNLTIDE
jgi:phage gp45-like